MTKNNSQQYQKLFLITPRLIIRSYETSDAQLLFNMITANRFHISDTMPLTVQNNKKLSDTINNIQERIIETHDGKNFVAGIFISGINKLIGQIAVMNIDWRVTKCELAYFVDADHQNRGYTTEAMQSILEYCFKTHQMKKVFLRIHPENKGSLRIAEKCGFAKHGIMHNDFKTSDGKLVDLEYWELLSK